MTTYRHWDESILPLFHVITSESFPITIVDQRSINSFESLLGLHEGNLGNLWIYDIGKECQ